MTDKKQSPQTPAPIGHNSDAAASARLKSFFARLDNIDAELAALKQDRKELCAEIKSVGFDLPVIMTIRKLMAEDVNKQAERRELIATYSAAIGVQLELFK